MSHEVEYHDSMMKMLEMIWGEGFMSPGGTENVDFMVEGLDIRGRHVLDIGCGMGGPDCHLSEHYGAHVTGVDLEAQLIENARHRAENRGLQSQCEFVLVEPGPLPFPDSHFDLIISAGAFTQTPDKTGMFAECYRVLRPGGSMSNFDWTKSEETISSDMAYFFKMEDLTYALERPETYRELFQSAGFTGITIEDGSDWYRRQSREEYQLIKGEMYARLVEAIGQQDTDHFVEDWRAMAIVFEAGELTQTYCRARKPL
jgi:phosphoethanolamine N-methyltransferase